MNKHFNIDGHRLTLLQNGQEFFPALSADIHTAQQSIYLETYIFNADETGQKIAEMLRLAAQRGVNVHVLLDGFGSAQLPDFWITRWRSAGVKLQWFRPEKSRFKLRRHRLRRLHRKLVCIDEQTAYIGGINIMDDIPKQDGLHHSRLDYAIRIQGTIVDHIQYQMRRLWVTVSRTALRRRKSRGKIAQPLFPFISTQLQFITRDNLRHRHDIEHAYLKAINSAKHSIIIANPYFLPGLRFRHALIKAAKRGVNVKLLLQGKVEYHLQHYATQALYQHFLPAGIEIYEYQASYLHAKVAVIDDQWSTVGSSNIDPFSLMLAREANLVINDTQFADTLRYSLLEEIQQDAVRITEWTHKNWFKRLWTKISYAFIRRLIGLISNRAEI